MLAFLALLIIFFGLFYFIMRVEVLYSIDEILFNRKNNIVKQFEGSNGRVPYEEFQFTDFKIIHAGRIVEDTYSDTLIYEPTDQEYDEYRKLVTSFSYGGKIYRLELVKAHLESDEIISTILMSLTLMFLLMALVFYFITKFCKSFRKGCHLCFRIKIHLAPQITLYSLFQHRQLLLSGAL